jgi:hypothetical protein
MAFRDAITWYHQLRNMGIKLVLPFLNNWGDYGGIAAYGTAFGSNATTFYPNAAAQTAYKAYVKTIMTRYACSSVPNRIVLLDPFCPPIVVVSPRIGVKMKDSIIQCGDFQVGYKVHAFETTVGVGAISVPAGGASQPSSPRVTIWLGSRLLIYREISVAQFVKTELSQPWQRGSLQSSQAKMAAAGKPVIWRSMDSFPREPHRN